MYWHMQAVFFSDFLNQRKKRSALRSFVIGSNTMQEFALSDRGDQSGMRATMKEHFSGGSHWLGS
jgi:hypothetical protein